MGDPGGGQQLPIPFSEKPYADGFIKLGAVDAIQFRRFSG
jgi:hypothetical protein